MRADAVEVARFLKGQRIRPDRELITEERRRPVAKGGILGVLGMKEPSAEPLTRPAWLLTHSFYTYTVRTETVYRGETIAGQDSRLTIGLALEADGNLVTYHGPAYAHPARYVYSQAIRSRNPFMFGSPYTRHTKPMFSVGGVRDPIYLGEPAPDNFLAPLPLLDPDEGALARQPLIADWRNLVEEFTYQQQQKA
jgi:hypothetical protein